MKKEGVEFADYILLFKADIDSEYEYKDECEDEETTMTVEVVEEDGDDMEKATVGALDEPMMEPYAELDQGDEMRNDLDSDIDEAISDESVINCETVISEQTDVLLAINEGLNQKGLFSNSLRQCIDYLFIFDKKYSLLLSLTHSTASPFSIKIGKGC